MNPNVPLWPGLLIIAIAVLFFLLGCDDATASLSNRTELTQSGPARFHVTTLEIWHREVQECLNRYTDRRPHVSIVEQVNGGASIGYTEFWTGFISIDQDWQTTVLFKHEFIHHILANTGYSDELNSNHEYDFDTCTWRTS